MARISRLLRRAKRKKPGTPSELTPPQTLQSDVSAESHGGDHAKPRDPENNPNPPPTPDNPTNHPRPGPVPPGEGGDPTTPGGPYDAQPNVPMQNTSAITVNTGSEFPPEFGPFLEQLARQSALDTSGQGYRTAQGIRDDLQAQVFRDYLTSLYGGDVLGINFNLPQPNMGDMLSAIQADTNQVFGAPSAGDMTPAPGPGVRPGEPTPGGPRAPRERPRDREGKRSSFAAYTPPQYGFSASGYGGGGTAAAAGEGERKQRWTEEQRRQQRQTAARRNAGAEWGYSYGSQGLRPGVEGGGGPFLNAQRLKKAFGAFAGPTWDWENRGGVLYRRPKANQTGRIAAQGGQGPQWEVAPDFVQKAFQNPARREFFDRNPDAEWDAFRANQGLRKHIGGGVIWLDPATGNYVNEAGEMWTPQGWKIENGVPQNQTVPWPTGGGGGGTGGGGGAGGGGDTAGGSLSSFIGNIPGGSWAQRESAFDPNNPNTWALMAPQASQIAGQLDAQKRDIRNQIGMRSGEAQRAMGDAINQSYGQIGGLRQNLITNALGYIQGRAHPDQQLPNPMGSASAGGNILGSKYSTDKQYNLGLQQLTQQGQNADKSFWGDVFGGIGGMVGGLLGNPGLFSDPAVKENITPHEGGLSILRALNTYDWTYNEKAKELAGVPMSGVMADEVKKVMPEAIHLSEDGLMKVDYSKLFASTINAVKELDARLSTLQKKKGKK